MDIKKPHTLDAWDRFTLEHVYKTEMPLEQFLRGTETCELSGNSIDLPNQMIYKGLVLHNKRLREVVGELTIPTFSPEPGTLRVALRNPQGLSLEAADLPAATTVAVRPVRL